MKMKCHSYIVTRQEGDANNSAPTGEPIDLFGCISGEPNLNYGDKLCFTVNFAGKNEVSPILDKHKLTFETKPIDSTQAFANEVNQVTFYNIPAEEIDNLAEAIREIERSYRPLNILGG
jgi:hypothetical protein